MALRVILFCSVVMLLDQVHGDAKDRNTDRTRLKAALKAITVDIPAWNKITPTGPGLNSRVSQLTPIVSAVTPVDLIKTDNFRADKKSPIDAKLEEKAVVTKLFKKANGISTGLDALKKSIGSNPQQVVNAASAISTFNMKYQPDVNFLTSEWQKPAVQKLLELND